MCEESLIHSVQSNKDEKSFLDLVSPYEGKVKAFLRNSTNKTPLDPDEVYNKALLNVWKGIDGFKGDGSFRAWFFQVARNVLYDEFNKLNKHSNNVSIDDQYEELVDFQDPSSSLIELEDNKALLEKLLLIKNSLREHHKKTFELVFEQGKTYLEAAKILECSLGTIQSRVFYTKKKIQQFIKRHEYSNSY